MGCHRDRRPQMPVMLQSPDYNPGRHSDILSKFCDNVFGIGACICEFAIPASRNETARGESVCLCFLSGLLWIINPLQKHIPFSVQNQMRGFVEEREPELIVGFVSKAQLNKRLFSIEPACCSTHSGSFDLWS